MTRAERIIPGTWMQSITNPNALLEIIDVAADGNVKIAMDGKTLNTTKRYLNNNYRALGDPA